MKRRSEISFASKLRKAYRDLCAFIKWLCLTVTLLLIPLEIVMMVYYTFIHFDAIRAVVTAIVLFITIDSNIKL